VVGACIGAGLVGGEGFAVDASLIVADANKQRSTPGSQWNRELDAQAVSRATKDYLATLDDAAFRAASDVRPKFVSPSDPAAQWTGAMRGPAFFAYSDNYLMDVKFGIIMASCLTMGRHYTTELIRKVWIHDEGFATSRFSMMRIMARRMKAATVLA